MLYSYDGSNVNFVHMILCKIGNKNLQKTVDIKVILKEAT